MDKLLRFYRETLIDCVVKFIDDEYDLVYYLSLTISTGYFFVNVM